MNTHEKTITIRGRITIGREREGDRLRERFMAHEWERVCMWEEEITVSQCDQIWPNFATLAKFYKSVAIFWRLVKYLARLWTYLGNVLCYWAKVHCCKEPNIQIDWFRFSTCLYNIKIISRIFSCLIESNPVKLETWDRCHYQKFLRKTSYKTYTLIGCMTCQLTIFSIIRHRCL